MYRRGEEGRTFHIIATGTLEVWRDGRRGGATGLRHLGWQMAYLAPNPDCGCNSTDVIVTDSATTISFTPDTLARLGPATRHLFDEAFIRCWCAGCMWRTRRWPTRAVSCSSDLPQPGALSRPYHRPMDTPLPGDREDPAHHPRGHRFAGLF